MNKIGPYLKQFMLEMILRLFISSVFVGLLIVLVILEYYLPLQPYMGISI